MSNSNNEQYQYNNQEQTLAQLRKELRQTRAICIVSLLLTMTIIVAAVLLGVKVKGYANQVAPIVSELTRLDTGEFNRTMENVNMTLTSVNWQKVSDSLEQLDVDALNTAIENLDTKELSESLKNLNDAISILRGVTNKITSFLDKFGN